MSSKGYSTRIRPGHDTDNSRQFSAYVKNEWNYPSNPSIHLTIYTVTTTFPFTKLVSENLKGKDHFEDLDVDGKTREVV